MSSSGSLQMTELPSILTTSNTDPSYKDAQTYAFVTAEC
jgi:hypothetical protein